VRIAPPAQGAAFVSGLIRPPLLEPSGLLETVRERKCGHAEFRYGANDRIGSDRDIGKLYSGKSIAVTNRDPRRDRTPPEVAPTRLPTKMLNFGLQTALLNSKSHMTNRFAFSMASRAFLFPLRFRSSACSSESRPPHLARSSAFLIHSARSLSYGSSSLQ
jgi:hypothetical protein